MIGETHLDGRGRSEWIREALERYESPLIRYAARLVGDPERGRDVVQDTFLRLCREKPSRVHRHLKAWLFKVCRNRALDILRKERRMDAMPDERLALQPALGPGPDRAFEAKENLSRVEEILDGLPNNQQEVVRLRFESGLSYREISRVTGLTETNVGFLLHTALKAVRCRMNEEPTRHFSLVRRMK